MPKFIDLTNKRVGKLTILERCENRGMRTFWKVQCDCGIIKEVSMSCLTHSNPKWKIKSCGCFQRAEATKRCYVHGLSKTPEFYMFHGAKRRAKKKKIEFSINILDIKIPKVCPLLKIPIKTGISKLQENSPSLDRINSNKGYIKDNIWVISYKANAVKNNCTINELELLVNNLKKYHADN